MLVQQLMIVCENFTVQTNCECGLARVKGQYCTQCESTANYVITINSDDLILNEVIESSD